jgi:hypothetical protein
MHVNLIIATPGHSVLSGYLRSLLAATQELNKRGISWAFSQEYASHVADAREITLNGDNRNDPTEQRPFKGEVTYDKILWIDSDIIFTPEDVIKSYESPYDIVAGAYMIASGEVVVYRKLFGPGLSKDEVMSMTEPEKVFGAGMGFMAVKSGVFESLTRPWFQSPVVTTQIDEKDFTFPIMGEDLSFCHRAGEAGFEIWFDPSLKLIHHKTFKITWEGLAI